MSGSVGLALFRKELRALLPAALAGALLFSLEALTRPLYVRLDEISWGSVFSDAYPGYSSEHSVALMILAMVVAYSAFPREHEEGTIQFLYGLPVSRAQVFLAKAAAGISVLIFIVTIEQMGLWLVQAANGQSFSGGQWRFSVAGKITLLYCAYAIFVYSHVLFASFLRRLGLLLYAFTVWACVEAETFSHHLGWLDFTQLLTLQYFGRELLIPWRELGLHALIGAITFVGAFFVWTASSEGFDRFYEGIRARRLGRAGLGCLSTLLFVVGFFFIDRTLDSDVPDSVEFEGYRVLEAHTQYYVFTYPSTLRDRAMAVIRDADEIYESVRTSLGASPREQGALFVVDLTERSNQHAGIAAGEKVRMGLHREDRERLRRTLSHESVHLFQHQESEGRLIEQYASVRFFMEGMATYVSLEIEPHEGTRRDWRRLAAAAWSRQGIRFEDLIDDGGFRAEHDDDLVYALGETWTAALVERYGSEAPGDLLRAMAREDAPQDLGGWFLWQDTMQAAGMDVEEALASWYALLERIESQEESFLETLPRLGGGPSGEEDGDLLLVMFVEPESVAPEYGYVVKIRNDLSTEEADMLTLTPEERDGDRIVFRVPSSRLRGRRFEFQFGAYFSPHVGPYYEMWQEGSIP